MNSPQFSLFSLLALLPSVTCGALVSTWTSSQDPADLGDAGAPSVLLTPDPVVGAPMEFTSSVSGTGTDYTDVVTLTSTQQTQLSSVGLSVTQGLNNVRGATRKLNGASLQSLAGVATSDATLDFFISPDNLNDVSQLIFETGGSGAGSSLNMNGNIMTFAAAQNAATAVTVGIDLSSIYAAAPNTDDMLVVRLGVDLTNDEVTISALNLSTGLSVNSSTAFTGTTWAGTDGTGIFNINGSTGGSAGGNVPATYSNFDGQLGGITLYTDEVLAPIPEPSSLMLVGLSLFGFVRRRR